MKISLNAILNMILSKERITKALTRLRWCAGWSAPLLFANPPKTGFLASRPSYKVTMSLLITLGFSEYHMNDIIFYNMLGSNVLSKAAVICDLSPHAVRCRGDTAWLKRPVFILLFRDISGVGFTSKHPRYYKAIGSM